MATPIDIGDVARVQLVFLDENDALETPTAVTVDVRSPTYPTTADFQVTEADAEVTLGKVFPLADRERLAARFPNMTAADLASGDGCVEYLHTVDETGVWRYHGKSTAPSTSAAQTSAHVRDAFQS